jgi:hypothetical protein
VCSFKNYNLKKKAFNSFYAQPLYVFEKMHVIAASIGGNVLSVVTPLDTSVLKLKRDALLIQFIESQRALHVSSITYSFSGGATLAFGILRAYQLAVARLQHCSRATVR